MELSTVWTGGHSQMVLCLGVDAEGRVASGSEGGEVCFWSPDGKITSKRTFPSKADVNSVCFSPQQPSVIYVSAGEVIELLDVRCPESSLERFAFNREDINQLAIDPKDGFLAACDDDGIIKVVDLRNRKLFRTLKGHSAICSSVRFHPTVPREIASGGLDCLVHTWETTRGSPRASVNMKEVVIAGEDEHTPSPYLINPPFVHSVDFTRSGELLACGLENARVQLLDRRGRRDLEVGQSLEAHTSGVTQVSFIPEYPGQMQDLLLSAGNDCRIMLWDTNRHTIPKDGLKPEDHTTENSEIENLKSESDKPPEQERAEKVSDRGDKGACSSDDSKTKPRLCVKHKDKINWIAPYCSASGVNMVFVADVSEIISVYQWKVD
ncbi:WD repeat-containing protein 53-like [Patiria miniata]|uniref:WD repeat-containing protein 53 n=1 Tax=Patiria miniata TaxID=46514 RepID=A0A913ZEL4_PATMI|nr:WD repeat-containing protein 53-like [Patiria miniata]XP_038050232.1 WD repeat-containing protein 53-like [Patiria miniata]XP_038070621.1 WD repeat-containing protein 53-like [Patiria miniata]XP_038070622.1 WD repeat-containing protein 53-like [Patiria miniata]XP_038070623.1 WD repeat-containing protein 53-like [Patiria miniata]